MIKCSGFRTKILAQKTKKKKKINHEKLDFMQRDLPFRKIKKKLLLHYALRYIQTFSIKIMIFESSSEFACLL